jgi:chlorite dismutase
LKTRAHSTPMSNVLNVSFVGGNSGDWHVEGLTTHCGPPLTRPSRLSMLEGTASRAHPTDWTLRGVTSHSRYTTRAEAQALAEKQPALRRPEATRAVLIPIRKRAEWWALPQDERRAIYEERSRHTTIGLEYLPRIARRLHHCRDLGEPFDFLTWFEFAPADTSAFDELLARLRATEEWTFVDREVEIRCTRAISCHASLASASHLETQASVRSVI